MQYRHLICAALASLFSNSAYAELSDFTATNKAMTFVVTLSAGPVWENAGQSQTFYLAPDIEKTYSAANTTHTLAEGQLFLGVQKKLPYSLLGQLGVLTTINSSANLNGNIWDDADPTFNNYNYNYSIQHTSIGVQGKLLFDQKYWVMPWISASVGVAVNNAYGFQNTALLYEAVDSPNFSSNSQTSLTYSVGFGLQRAITSHWQVGASYEFADWGHSQLGKAPGQTMNSGLNLNHLYTNGLLLNVTYLA